MEGKLNCSELMKKMSSRMYLELKMRGSMFKVQLLPLAIGP